MIVVFTGYSSSGKSSYQTKFLESRKDFSKSLAYTTRPIRDGEKDGVDYFFIESEEFLEKRRTGEVILTRKYNVIENNQENVWHYGMGQKSLDGNKCIVLDPDGTLELIERVGKENLMIIYFFADEKDLYFRAAIRGDERKEFSRRLISDKEEFPKILNEVDLIIYTSQESREDDIVKIITDKMEELWGENGTIAKVLE